MTARILIADPIAKSGVAALEKEAEVVVAKGLTAEALLAEVSKADALIVRSETQVTRPVLEAGKQLKAVGRAGVGIDNIDVAAATELGVLVLNVPNANTLAAAELAMGLMLALVRRIPAADATMRAGTWEKSRFTGTELYGKTLGVIGFGRIGRAVADRAKAFGMQILAYDPYVPAEHLAAVQAERCDLDQLLARADIVTLHAQKTKETHGLLDAANLAKMKPGSFLVNVARGGQVDEEALYDALERGHLAGAALDVFAKEPVLGHRLAQLPQVILTPHIGASTKEAQERNGRDVAIGILQALRGQRPEGAVNQPADWPRKQQA